MVDTPGIAVKSVPVIARLMVFLDPEPPVGDPEQSAPTKKEDQADSRSDDFLDSSEGEEDEEEEDDDDDDDDDSLQWQGYVFHCLEIYACC